MKGFQLYKYPAYAWVNTEKEVIIKIGCEQHKATEWLKIYKKLGTENKYTNHEKAMIYAQIKLIIKCFKGEK